MIKTTLLAMPDYDNESVEIERLQQYLSDNGYQSDCTHLRANNDIDEHYARLDLSSKIFYMSIYSESSVYPESILILSELANKIKAEITDSVIIFGSKYASVYFKEILGDKRFLSVDCIILGDGEYTLTEVIDYIDKNGEISEFAAMHKNIASKISMNDKEFLNIDINKLPLPNRFLITNNSGFETYYASIVDSHGCCMNCSFCTQGQFYKKWTGRTAESIFFEIKKINNDSSMRCFWFTRGSFEDPDGELGTKKIRDLCNYIVEDNLLITMKCYMRSNFVSKCDPELLKLMKKAGFCVVLIGIESANNYDLQLYNKGTTVENNILALTKLRQAGIYAEHFGFIMINPYSTPERLQANFCFLEDQQPHDLNNYVHHVVADPGTAIRKRIEDDGLLISTDDFLKSGISYRFQNKHAAEISAFLHKYFLSFNTETAEITTFILHMTPFLPNGRIYEREINLIMCKRALFFSDYFRTLYVDMDIGLCERQYDEFMTTFYKYDTEVSILKNRIIKDLIKYKIVY